MFQKLILDLKRIKIQLLEVNEIATGLKIESQWNVCISYLA